MNRICLIIFLSLIFFLELSAESKKKDYYVKINIHTGSGLTTKKNQISVSSKKIVYRNRIFRYKKIGKSFQARLMVSENNPISIKGEKYFGRIIVHKKKIKNKKIFRIINQIPLETYLIGVVDKEISYSWPLEAIKAQAIAARTYAIFHMIKNKNEDYHLVNTTQHQVFKGIKGINDKIIEGVEKTRGVIMMYDGKPVETFFHASCGGQTEEPKYVWTSTTDEYPYLKSVICGYCTTHPKFSWEYSIKAKEFQNKLNKFVKNQKIKRIDITKLSPSKRVMEIELVTAKQKVKVSGNNFRIAINPKELSSTKFKIKQKSGQVKFIGNGFGHGVGLCQWGSKTLAEKGKSYRQILNFYYHDIVLKKMKI